MAHNFHSSKTQTASRVHTTALAQRKRIGPITLGSEGCVSPTQMDRNHLLLLDFFAKILFFLFLRYFFTHIFYFFDISPRPSHVVPVPPLSHFTSPPPSPHFHLSSPLPLAPPRLIPPLSHPLTLLTFLSHPFNTFPLSPLTHTPYLPLTPLTSFSHPLPPSHTPYLLLILPSALLTPKFSFFLHILSPHNFPTYFPHTHPHPIDYGRWPKMSLIVREP